MGFLELLSNDQDKVTAREMADVKKRLPERIKVSIPACMYYSPGDDGVPELDFEVVTILAWVISRRENPDIEIAEVGDRIGARNDSQLRQIVEKILYFYTIFSSEEVHEKFFSTADSEDGESVNPIPESPLMNNSES